MSDEKNKSNMKDYRNVYLGVEKDEIIDRLHAEYSRLEKPNEKFKVPKYKNNRVRTSKYNCIDFLPKSILVQFLRLYNFYFLITVILQGVPQVSTMPVYLAALPFVFVIGISIFREGIEDIKRRIQDRKTNNITALVLGGQKFHETRWADLKVGDVILVHEDETLPADLLLLQ